MTATSPAAPRFVSGPILRHVIVMAGTGAIGLIAVFAVDLANLFYISILGQKPIAAAIGFAGAVGFFQTAISIGMTIGVGAVASREIGAGRREEARRIAGASVALMVIVGAIVGIGTVLALGPILDFLGAAGETRRLAAGYLTITSPSLPLTAAGMGFAALLRAAGDARRAMNVTLAGAVATALLDPLFIFGLHLDLEGAAIATVLARLLLCGLGWHAAHRRHDLLARIEPRHLWQDVHPVLAIAGPAILTNLATPVGAAYVTRAMAGFGPDAVAGQATIDRISPVAFGLVYALTGAVGPILGQNLGAGRLDRLRETLRDSLLVVLATVLAAWAVLAAAERAILFVFSAEGDARVLIDLFCSWLAGGFVFTGCLFVANAAFNNLGYPLLSTLFNWGRATLGTIPFVAIGRAYGPTGVLYGQTLGSFVFGLIAVIVAFRVTRRLRAVPPSAVEHGLAIPSGSGRAALATLAAPAARSNRG
ncbi:MATE family efflux transporter [Aliidongia dinghuensis]|uniref:MATE family efflux transporter n=1 Tax=Aliidongia dinghuensis TaxID=1867774 RepID=A0A8J3E2R2_9PROT|nr:MATE family efflux transporter [Aliidongia dinghuensis]GGF10393.1 MATE family efflux transporter [Aliidongia dinghuensis]